MGIFSKWISNYVCPQWHILYPVNGKPHIFAASNGKWMSSWYIWTRQNTHTYTDTCIDACIPSCTTKHIHMLCKNLSPNYRVVCQVSWVHTSALLDSVVLRTEGERSTRMRKRWAGTRQDQSYLAFHWLTTAFPLPPPPPHRLNHDVSRGSLRFNFFFMTVCL